MRNASIKTKIFLHRILTLRYIPMFCVLTLTRILLPVLKKIGLILAKKGLKPLDWSPGISIIIPERDNFNLLVKCLTHLYRAVEFINEPFEVIVVINGSAPKNYMFVQSKYPDIKWVYSQKPLGFSQAIRMGLDRAVYSGVYLLNNDMFLQPEALQKVMQCRASFVFAVASQIFFVDSVKRREETGWTDMRITQTGVEIFDVAPEDQQLVRGTLYSGGGASLFHRDTLKKTMPKWDPYHPFYWEDVHWGLRAWYMGYESLFCPESKAFHMHRATVSRFYDDQTIDRIFKRNGILFELQNLLEVLSPKNMVKYLRKKDLDSQIEIANPLQCLNLLLNRIITGFLPFSNMPITGIRRKFYLRSNFQNDLRPVIIMVSPFAIYPTCHGGAVRMTNLIKNLRSDFDIIVLSDEDILYRTEDIRRCKGPMEIHLVCGRKNDTSEAGASPSCRIERIISHSHEALQIELNRLIMTRNPNIIQIEYMELAGLIEDRHINIPWILTLHDVLLSGPADRQDDVDRFEMNLIKKFNAVIVCSEEDRKLINMPDAYLVRNGAAISIDDDYIASEDTPNILFLGPFRYLPNLEGITIFLEKVYPQIQNRIPDVRLDILGGENAISIAAKSPLFKQTGVRIHESVSNVHPFLKKCALTINPQYNTRGSSVKLIESLVNGRVCISTKDGARGYVDLDLPQLVVVDTIEAFIEPIEKLLTDSALRRKIEKPDKMLLQMFDWNESADIQTRIYRHFM